MEREDNREQYLMEERDKRYSVLSWFECYWVFSFVLGFCAAN